MQVMGGGGVLRLLYRRLPYLVGAEGRVGGIIIFSRIFNMSPLCIWLCIGVYLLPA